MRHEIELKKAGKTFMVLTAHTEDSVAAFGVKENLEIAYPKEDGYTIVVTRIEETRQRLICVVDKSTFMMPKETA